MQRKPKILVIYKGLGYPLRVTLDEHLYAFRRYADAECYYLMLDMGKERFNSTVPIPGYLLKIDFDIILFHYAFVATRWDGQEPLDRAIDQVWPLKNSKAVKAVFTQDEFKNSAELCYFINKFNIDVVFTLATDKVARQIFDEVDFNRVKFYRVLTGYIDDKNVKAYKKLSKNIEKDIDLGYRARNLPQWLGRHGYMKSEIADIFKNAAVRYNLRTDISIRPEDTLLGKKWPEFLLRCKYMIGVEGGATVLDKYGTIWKNGTKYLKDHPNCTFEEIEAACFPGLDGKLELINLSPRHLECCITKTCQVMLESTFNDILKADVHYIAVKNDFSNLDEVLQKVKGDTYRIQMTERAYKDIVESGLYSYRKMVEFAIEKCLLEKDAAYFELNNKFTYHYFVYNRFQDWMAWKKYYYWERLHHKWPNKWFFLNPVIKFIKFFGLKNIAKKTFFGVTGKKSFLNE